MRKKLLFSMLLLFVGVSMQAQSIAAEQMDERFNDGTKMPYGWFAEGWKVDDGKAKAKATEDSGNNGMPGMGGGDTACEEAQYLASLAKKVYMIVRRDVLRASDAMQQKVKEAENIEILWNTQTEGLYGDNGVEGAHLIENKGKEGERRYDLPIDGFFLAIGHHPNSEIFRPDVEVDAQGYIKVQHPTTATNVPGVFAAGDVADPLYRQAISAAGSGCHAAIDALHYLQEKGIV